MNKPLDPRFGKVIARMRSTTFKGERDAARAKADEIAAQCGMSYDEALKLHDAPATQKPASLFDDFEDWMEKSEPGYKTKRAAEKARRDAAWSIRRAALLARYGSMEAALAPCWREALILAAVAPWRVARPDPERAAGWTDSLDTYHSQFPGRVPAHVRDAICAAYPLPATFAEAKAEHDYWRARSDELDDLFSEDGSPLGDDVLDMAAGERAEIVRELARHQLPVITIADLHGRFAMMMASECNEDEMQAALFRDLTAMVEREGARLGSVHHPSTPASAVRAASICPEQGGQIADVLRLNPSRSDRAIARDLGYSPTTVGNVRRALGLASTVRSVQRGGQVFAMKAGRQVSKATEMRL